MAIKSRDSMHSLQRERSRLTREVGRLESTLAAEAERALEAEQRAERMNDLYTVLSFWTTALNQQSDTAQAQVEALRAALSGAEIWGDDDGNSHWCSGTGPTWATKQKECDLKCLPSRRALAAPAEVDNWQG
jgi:hypothetical protein